VLNLQIFLAFSHMPAVEAVAIVWERKRHSNRVSYYSVYILILTLSDGK
jgi:hypothetical protein